MKLHKLSHLLLLFLLLFPASPIIITGCSSSLFARKPGTLSESELKNVLKEITVKVIVDDKEAASGTIIKKQNGFYTVLTNYHVIENAKSVKIVTPDNQVYPVEFSKVDRQDNKKDDLYDLAKLTFSSETTYLVAGLGEENIKPGEKVFAGGYVKGNLQTTKGTAKLFLNQPLIKGQQIAYDNDIQQGMSGGAIINEKGYLVGINSKIAHPVLQTDFRYLQGEQPDEKTLKEWGNYSWGIAINLVDEAAPDLALFPERVIRKVGGIPAKVLDIAKQSSVQIKQANGGIGSGVIIAKDNDIYYVLTAAHVVENKQEYQVVAPDKQVYKVDNQTIRTRKGLDMAVLQFRSSQVYQVATLGDYALKEQYVFLYGWKGEELNHPSLFSVGAIFSTLDSGTLSTRKLYKRGYDLVYTNEGYSGMSGGGIWDTEGRLIGIHNYAETDIVGYSLGLSVQTFLFLQKETLWNLPEAKLNIAKNEPSTENVSSIKISLPSAPNETDKGIRWLEYGIKLWRIQEYSKAIEAMEEAIKLDQNLWQVYYNISFILVSQGKYELALSTIDMAINKQTKEIHRSYLLKSIILGQFQKHENALEAINLGIKAAEESQKQEPLLYLVSGYLLEKSKQYNEAIENYNKALELDPRTSEVYLLRGGIYEEQKRLDLAITDYTQAININPNFAGAYNNRGNIYREQGKKELAIADYTQAININPKFPGVYSNRAQIYGEQGKKELAIADYTQAINLNNTDVTSYNNRGNIYRETGKINLAISDFNQAIKISPKSSFLWYNRGISYFEKKDYSRAFIDFNKAIEINPKFAESYYYRGVILSLLSSGEEHWEEYAYLAISDCTRAISINPLDAGSYYLRGIMYGVVSERILQSKKQQETKDLERVKQLKKSVIEDLETAKKIFQQEGNVQNYQTVERLLKNINEFKGEKLLMIYGSLLIPLYSHP
ncbi:tetratricopeptide repeat-containing serine protease family protein [Anabaena sp. UHCC 0451]|uniref:tetratricopeptide repeat-containing S1 family peptidase n=1 Tax=Anabaena sp. UHCC 0451 TaxID=2055235 RepID=UPI002B1FED11|nr:tetratricopeptide repeat protein [Anabaena sp. UHCC 0451]MEA5577859.1 tetratricopeptide repeat protein [Anabaena sp. UHCC 0451]